jgi:hypothetical protein
MSLEALGEALDSLKDWPTKIGIIGGEPILHHQFAECCALIQSKFPRQKMVLFTSGGRDWPRYKELARRTFGAIALNEHNLKQKKVCRHQRLTVAIRDIIKDEKYRNELIDDCWVQRLWSPMITMKGAFFCEVAASQDLLWDGPGGYPIEHNWWKRTPGQFKDQRDRYCENCGMCVPMDRDLIGGDIEQMSPSVYAKMREHRNAKIDLGERIEIYGKQLSVAEAETKKLDWYPANYRGDLREDRKATAGRGSTVFHLKSCHRDALLALVVAAVGSSHRKIKKQRR